MSTSGTTAFNLDLNDLIEEAFERCGLELRSGYDFRTARRSLNLLTVEWANRGINLWTVEQGQITMNTGQAMYALPNNTIDLLDQVIRQNNGSSSNQIDINISRISEPTYSTIPNKLTQGRPIQVWINRQSGQSNISGAATLSATTPTSDQIIVDNINLLPSAGFIQLGTEIISYNTAIPLTDISGFPNAGLLTNLGRGQQGTTPASYNVGRGVLIVNPPSINVWPTPNAGGGYTFVYWRMRRIQDAGTGVNDQDIPFRFIPCMVAGLAYYIAMKKPEVSPDRVMMLKTDYEQQFQLASEEDREKAPIRFVPRTTFYA
jgi:hypothetical protein